MGLTDQGDGLRSLRAMGLPISISILVLFWALVIALLLRLA